MDAFSVSIANGLRESKMKPARMCIIAGCYACFQFAMPVIGWVLVRTLVGIFDELKIIVPWVGFVLLIYIGSKMIIDTVKEIKLKKVVTEDNPTFREETVTDFKFRKITAYTLIVQGIATSIDALSVGFTLSEYHTVAALLSALLIAIVTFVICMFGLKLGKTIGNGLGKYSGFLGGAILIGIGIEILLKGLLG